ncbi:MAG: ATP-binding protein [Clostridiales bacterium]|nr:ATP-binding protein [Clostridiales bacterium]
MNKKIIVVCGYLAGGKSTFAKRLSKELNVPYFIKDTFKMQLCANIEVLNREEKSRFSAVTFDAMMYVAERFMETGFPIIIEGNFAPRGIKKIDEAGVIKSLIDKYDYRALTYKFIGDTKILHKRFTDREKLAERGWVNQFDEGEIPYEKFNIWCHNLDDFNVGGIVTTIDTTDFLNVDFEILIETARSFFSPEK